jgi:hypothetical protein
MLPAVTPDGRRAINLSPRAGTQFGPPVLARAVMHGPDL